MERAEDSTAHREGRRCQSILVWIGKSDLKDERGEICSFGVVMFG